MQKLFFLLVFGIKFAFSQLPIAGKVVNAKGEGLSFVTIALMSVADSNTVMSRLSDSTGHFLLPPPAAGSYTLEATRIGYNPFMSGVLRFNPSDTLLRLPDIVLMESKELLKAIVVSAAAPLFEQKVDRMVINIERTVTTAGATVLDILERSPGVTVDKTSGSITMLGKEGVNVMINGKLTYMPADALTSYLQSMDASNISKLELITNPPANVDAQGNAGYINIILKKNVNEGLQGSVSVTGGFGRGTVGMGSVNLSYRKRKLSFFGNYSYAHNGQLQWTVVDRKIGEYATNITLDRKPVRDDQNMRFGVDFQSSTRTTIGLLISGYLNVFDMNALNTIQNSAGIGVDTTILSRIHEINKWRHLQINGHLSHDFKKGANLSVDADLLHYQNDNPATYDLTYTTNNLDFQRNDLTSMKTTPFVIRVFKADYRHPISKTTRWDFGAKMIFSDFENDVIASSAGIILADFTSKSDLTEQLKSLYSEIEHRISKMVNVKGGLRCEFTTTALSRPGNQKIFERRYGNLFPSAFAEYSINADQQLNFQYSRRINRPAFSDMAPFITFLEPNSSFSGNESLQPAIADVFRVGYRLRKINLAVQYTREDSTIVRFQNRFDPANNRLLISPDNLRGQQILSFTIGLPTRITSWWTGNLFGIFQYQESTTVERNGNYRLQQGNVRINATQTITFPRRFKMEFTGFYQTPSLNGNVRFASFRVLNWAIQKKIKSKTTLTFGIDDIFNSLVNAGVTDLPNERLYVKRRADFSQRTFKIVFAISFGNAKMQMGSDRNPGGEEKGRVN